MNKFFLGIVVTLVGLMIGTLKDGPYDFPLLVIITILVGIVWVVYLQIMRNKEYKPANYTRTNITLRPAKVVK